MTNHHSYHIGDVALSCDIDTSHGADAESKRAVSSAKVGDVFFIRRSDRVWRYAIVADVSPNKASHRPYIVFTVTADGSTKKVGEHHWGDRLRPLKRHKPMGGRSCRNISENAREKSLHSSYGTATTSPYDSQSSMEFDRAAKQGILRGSLVHESGDTNEPANELDEAVSPVPPRQRRRGSLKDLATGFIRRISGQNTQPIDITLCDSTSAIEDVKSEFHEGEPIPNDDIERPQESEAMKTEVATQSRRKPRQKGASAELTTSSLFKNLMNGVNELSIDEAPKVNRRATVDLVADEEQDYFSSNSNNVAPPKNAGNKYKPRRNRRRATVSECRRPAIASRTDNSISASIVMKNAFTQLMEEKKALSQSQLREDKDGSDEIE